MGMSQELKVDNYYLNHLNFITGGSGSQIYFIIDPTLMDSIMDYILIITPNTYDAFN